MSEQDKQIHVRVPESLKDRLEKAAKTSGRSTNAEIVQRLEASLMGEGSAPKVVAVPADLHLSSEELSWLGLWGDMTETQRRRALAILEAAISVDAT